MSTRSPASSLVTALTREPRTPTQVPIGSTRLSCDCTAILAREPGSRAQLLISSRPCSISGTSCANSSIMKSGAVRDSMICGPRRWGRRSRMNARTRSPERRFSFGIISLRFSRPSTRPALDDEVALVEALDGAGHDLVAAREEVVQQLLALGVADLLQDHLLGGLRADAADRHRIDRLLDVVVDLDVGNLLLRFEQQDFRVRHLQAGLVRHDVPAAEGLVVAGVAIDRDADVDLAVVAASSLPTPEPPRPRRTRRRARRSSRARSHRPASAFRGSLRGPPALALAARLEIEHRHEPCLVHFVELEVERLLGLAAIVAEQSRQPSPCASELPLHLRRPASGHAMSARCASRRSAASRPASSAADRARATTPRAARNRCPRPPVRTAAAASLPRSRRR